MSYYTCMPPHGDPSAPTFDGTHLGLKMFFDELEYLFEDAGELTDQQKKAHAKRYLDYRTRETWNSITDLQDPTMPYDAWKRSIFELYPDPTSRFDLTSLVSRTAEQQITSEQELASYHRQFLSISSRLLENGRISPHDASQLFLQGLGPHLHQSTLFRISVTMPHLQFDDLPSTADLYHAALWMLRSPLHSTPLTPPEFALSNSSCSPLHSTPFTTPFHAQISTTTHLTTLEPTHRLM